MQTPDLRSLAHKLVDEFNDEERSIIERYLEHPTDFRSLLCHVFGRADILVDDGREVEKGGERCLKECLYRLQTLCRQLVQFMNTDDIPTHTLLSFRTSTKEEIRFFKKQLQRQHFTSYTSGFKREIVVGREYIGKRDELVKMLLDSHSPPFIHILSPPASGKSYLAQLARLNSHLQGSFSSINLTYPFDHPQLSEAVKYALSFSNTMKDLLIIDDISDFKLLQPLFFKSKNDSRLLEAAKFGTKIVTTSCFQLQNCPLPVSVITLSGLNPDETCDLFQEIAFPNQENPPTDLVDIGLKICKKCENIPGVITIAASIMSSKSTPEEWTHFLDVVIPSVSNPVATMSSISKLTERTRRHHFKTKWRHCFALCSLIPKDYPFKKDRILQLWKLQEDFSKDGEGCMTGEERGACFEEFMRCGYFIQGDNIDSISSYKIPYLVAELMKHVAGYDFCLVDELISKPYHKIIRYASFIIDPSWEPPLWLSEAKQLQSIVLWPRKFGESIPLSMIDLILSRMPHLRALRSKVLHCGRPPQFLVRPNKLESLTLGAVAILLLHCFQYKSSQEWVLYDKVEEADLTFIVKYVGLKKLIIRYRKHYDSHEVNALQQNNDTIRSLVPESLSCDGEMYLDPHQTLESLEISELRGKMFPAWITDELSLFISTLVSIQIDSCRGFQHLPGFNTLPHLSSLQLGAMSSLNLRDGQVRSWKQINPCRYRFPLLTQIRFRSCPKLTSMPSVPMLDSLKASNTNASILNHLLCPRLKSDTQESAETYNDDISLHGNLEIDGCKEFDWEDKSNDIEKGVWHGLKYLCSLELNNAPQLVSLPRGLTHITTLKQLTLSWLTNLKVVPEFSQLRQLTIHHFPRLMTLSNSKSIFSELEELEIWYCPRLTEFPQSLPDLKKLRVQEFGRLGKILDVSPKLEELEINNCDELDYDTPNDEGLTTSKNVWEGLESLHSLKLIRVEQIITSIDFEQLSGLHRVVIQNCPELTELPKSLCSHSALEYLKIGCCPGLTKHPEFFENLKHLKEVDIRPKPHEKCEEQTGEDFKPNRRSRPAMLGCFAGGCLQ